MSKLVTFTFNAHHPSVHDAVTQLADESQLFDSGQDVTPFPVVEEEGDEPPQHAGRTDDVKHRVARFEYSLKRKHRIQVVGAVIEDVLQKAEPEAFVHGEHPLAHFVALSVEALREEREKNVQSRRRFDFHAATVRPASDIHRLWRRGL